MFEDSTFASNGRIGTRSRFWMIATFIFNGSILLALILIPLIHPEALPRQAIAFLMATPATPTPTQPMPKQTAQPVRAVSEMQGIQLVAPRRIPPGIFIPSGKEPAAMKTSRAGIRMAELARHKQDISKPECGARGSGRHQRPGARLVRRG